MKRIFWGFVALSIVFGGVTTAVAMHHEIKVQQKQGIGKYLTDTEGNTLYWFKKDPPGASTCSGQCVDKWPLYFRPTVAPPAGIAAQDFATITRADGKQQTTFRGYPLYYFAGDKRAGATNGQGVNDVWFVVQPDNFPPK